METQKRFSIQSYWVVLFVFGLLFSCEQLDPMEEPLAVLEEFQDLSGLALEPEDDPINGRLVYTSDCESDCIEPGSGNYFAIKDSKSQSSGINTKKVSYKAYNTEDKFVVKVKYEVTSGPSQAKASITIQINGKKKEFKAVPSGYTATFAIPLENGWEKCEEVIFSIVQKGLGTPISFSEDYNLILVCKNIDKGLILWNKLGSIEEVLNSEVGPDLAFFDEDDGLNISANRAFVPGKIGKGITIAPGDYFITSRIHNLVLNNLNSVLNPDRGTISVWFYQKETPVGYEHNPYRIFDGPYGLEAGIGLSSFDDSNEGKTNVLLFELGKEESYVSIKYDDFNKFNGQWVHIAAVWDREGISGSNETMQLFINGTKVASTTKNNWNSGFGERADIAGANDFPEGKFILDEIKIYNVAKTNF
ncbi:LamG domain-containing protein [Aquiflexum gelatinilyticum]|uniref:LamG domain-containing protein n=1 Tax=Aquiflexum gelatinilyticum TaxID=2961943 RepID=A0A9X2P900_9BACT|nr:LamG domain-containing protein [Aquiflexum gelatinilyticum]MCR9015419.1 LamG domain-containing protein [Aquiflexum gelatinilyticum]